ncbi:sensor histidine kinase [Deinococcus misasensis]|uniref:sensor histidine kinase n=1 Tax=Deinococcus misasensis TaxID=392413 RepID=UPI0005513704|nr:ATP-binding protein [Deinococcus misasensis]
MHSVLDELPQAIILHDHGRVSFLNRMARELWHVENFTARGRPIIEVLRRHTLDELVRKGGELELMIGGRELLCKSVPGALICEDVTEKNQSQRELREVMAVLSHEFRTPVAGIMGVLEALQYDLPAEMRENFVSQGLLEVRRLARLVEDMTVGFRVSTLRDIQFRDVTSRAERLLQPELEKTGVTLKVEGEDVHLHADADKLLQVVLNLAENAIRYGPNPGVIVLKAALEHGQVWIGVLDEGRKLPDYEVIFKPHQRGPSAKGYGSGMGLYIIRSIAESWGGVAEGRHVPQKGNEFRVSVPL